MKTLLDAFPVPESPGSALADAHGATVAARYADLSDDDAPPPPGGDNTGDDAMEEEEEEEEPSSSGGGAPAASNSAPSGSVVAPMQQLTLTPSGAPPNNGAPQAPQRMPITELLGSIPKRRRVGRARDKPMPGREPPDEEGIQRLYASGKAALRAAFFWLYQKEAGKNLTRIQLADRLRRNSDSVE